MKDATYTGMFRLVMQVMICNTKLAIDDKSPDDA